jgi:hypothetical protein
MIGWKPIDSAPKDGSVIIGIWRRWDQVWMKPSVVRWRAGEWSYCVDAFQSAPWTPETADVFWRPLPEPPDIPDRWGWQDISTAPLDGTTVELFIPAFGDRFYGPGSFAVHLDDSAPEWRMHNKDIGWCRAHPPTHWRPLPEPSKECA